MILTDSPTLLDTGSILNGLLPTVKTLSHVDILSAGINLTFFNEAGGQ